MQDMDAFSRGINIQDLQPRLAEVFDDRIASFVTFFTNFPASIKQTNLGRPAIYDRIVVVLLLVKSVVPSLTMTDAEAISAQLANHASAVGHGMLHIRAKTLEKRTKFRDLISAHLVPKHFGDANKATLQGITWDALSNEASKDRSLHLDLISKIAAVLVIKYQNGAQGFPAIDLARIALEILDQTPWAQSVTKAANKAAPRSVNIKKESEASLLPYESVPKSSGSSLTTMPSSAYSEEGPRKRRRTNSPSCPSSPNGVLENPMGSLSVPIRDESIASELPLSIQIEGAMSTSLLDGFPMIPAGLIQQEFHQEAYGLLRNENSLCSADELVDLEWLVQSLRQDNNSEEEFHGVGDVFQL